MTDWDGFYAQIIGATGWSWDQVDALTMPRYRALVEYWREYPPLTVLLRALLGFKTREHETVRAGEAMLPFEALAALAPSGTLNLGALAQL